MTEYIRQSQDGGLFCTTQNEDAQPFLTILNIDEFRERKEQFHQYKVFLHSLGSIRYCNADVFLECIFGTLRIPQMS